MRKRLLAFFIAFVMIAALIPLGAFTAFADNDPEPVYYKVDYIIGFDQENPVIGHTEYVASDDLIFSPYDEEEDCPYTPVKSGYNFLGWYADKDCTEPFEFGENPTGDTLVYAGYEAKPVLSELNLTFLAPMAGDSVTVTEKQLPYGDGFTPGNRPDRVPQIILPDNSCKSDYSLFINSISGDAINGYVPDGDLFSGTFEAGNTYYIFFIVESSSVLFDTENFTLNIDGATAEKVFCNDDAIFVWASFEPGSREGKTVISEINLSVTPPVAGESVYLYENYDEYGNFISYEQDNMPQISFYYDGLGLIDSFKSLFYTNSVTAYVEEGYDSDNCPFGPYGYTFFEDDFEAGEEYIAAIKLVLVPDKDDEPEDYDKYVFADKDSLVITVEGNDDIGFTYTSDGHTLIVYINVAAKDKHVIKYANSLDEYESYEVNVFEGDVTVEAECPFKERGFAFTCWYEDPECTKPFEFGHELTEDITLYAGWKEVPLISELELTFTPPKAGQTVEVVLQDVKIPGTDLVYPATLPTLTADLKAEDERYQVTYAYFIYEIPEDLEWGETDWFEGTLKAGETYVVDFNVQLNERDSFDFAAPEDLTVTVSGGVTGRIVPDPENNYEYNNAHFYMEFTIPPVEYKVDEGAGQEVLVEEGKEARFHITADFSLFKNDGKVYVDDKLVDAKYYVAEEGSTVIKLKPEFIETLDAGKHMLKVVFGDGGVATAPFEVVEKETPAETEKTAATDGTAPNTADPNNYFVWVAMIMLSACGVVATEIRFRKETVYNG